MRRIDREMPEPYAKHVFDRCTYATLSMLGEDGAPYGVPISIVRADNALYFHSAKLGRKIDSLRKQARVSVSAVEWTHVPAGKFTTEYSSAVADGIAEEVLDTEEKIRALRLICEKYTPGNLAAFDDAIARSLERTAVWKISVGQFAGKRKKYDANGQEMKFGRME